MSENDTYFFWELMASGTDRWERAQPSAYLPTDGMLSLRLPSVDGDSDGTRVRVVLVASGNPTERWVSKEAKLTVVGSNVPLIIENPTDVTVDVGADATFTAAVAGDGVRTQWQVSTDGGRTWSDVEGATSTTLHLQAPTPEMTRAWYRAVHTNAAGSVETDHAVLLVRTAPVFTTTPSDNISFPGNTALFLGWADDGASGTTLPLSWEISRDGQFWAPYEHGTFPELMPSVNMLAFYPVAAEMDGLRFRAVAENHLGRAVSEPALLTVAAAPVIDSHPANARILVGYEATFSASTPAVSPSRAQQWQVRVAGGEWADIPGATQPVYSTGPTTLAMDQNEYRIVFTNAYGSTASEPATLTVREPLPASVSIAPTVRLVDRLP